MVHPPVFICQGLNSSVSVFKLQWPIIDLRKNRVRFVSIMDAIIIGISVAMLHKFSLNSLALPCFLDTQTDVVFDSIIDFHDFFEHVKLVRILLLLLHLFFLVQTVDKWRPLPFLNLSQNSM
jgi:hypothetical protein